MEFSRRDLRRLLPALAAAGAAAQDREERALSSKVYHQEQIPFEGDGKKKGRRYFCQATQARSSTSVRTRCTVPATPGPRPAPPQRGRRQWHLRGATGS